MPKIQRRTVRNVGTKSHGNRRRPKISLTIEGRAISGQEVAAMIARQTGERGEAEAILEAREEAA